MRTAGRVAIPALLLSTLAGCTIPGLYDSSHENDGGHKGQVVDGITGKGLTGAWLTGALPTYRDRIIKTRGEGLFCYHNQGNPGGVTFHCKGYISRTVSMDLFYRATIFELEVDRRPKTGIWGGEKEDLLTPFERKIVGGGEEE